MDNVVSEDVRIKALNNAVTRQQNEILSNISEMTPDAFFQSVDEMSHNGRTTCKVRNGGKARQVTKRKKH